MADNYSVTNQYEASVFDAEHKPERVMHVTFDTKPSGVSSYVDVPMAHYAPEHVHEQISELASKIEAVHAL